MYTEATESYQMPTYGMATKVSVVTIGAMFLILGTIGKYIFLIMKCVSPYLWSL